MSLTVYTPTFRRPRMLEQCKASVAAQTIPVEHVIVHDTVGVGIGGMYARIREHVDLVHGDYVMVLSDDNILIDPKFSGSLQARVAAAGKPDVVVFRGDIEGTVQPLVWGAEPVETKIDLSCFAVRRDVWVENAGKWGERYEGDFDFIHSLWEQGCRFVWWDRLVFRALQVSRGEAEAAA